MWECRARAVRDWLAIGYLSASDHVEYMAFQDADVVNYHREMLARLVLPAVDPTVDFHFVKGYYARVSDRLHGRVTLLLLTPLPTAFVRLMGENPYISYLSSFRYALSGEFAVQRDLAVRMRLPSDWGLEIVSLLEALRHRTPRRICQAEPAERYDHKHQPVFPEDPSQGLNRMARDVCKHLLRTLAAAGVNPSDGLFRSLLSAFRGRRRIRWPTVSRSRWSTAWLITAMKRRPTSTPSCRPSRLRSWSSWPTP